MLALHIIEIVFPLFFIAALGAFYALRYKPDMTVVNTLNLTVFVPALIFTSLVNHKVELASFQPLIIGAVIVILGSGVLGCLIARLFAFEIKTFVPPMMFSNTGNMGLPLLVLAFGSAALPAATILFVVENSLHFTLGSYLLNKRENLIKNILSPIILATAAAFAVNALHIPLNNTLMQPINMMGNVSIPIMLFSLGTRLAHANFAEWKIGLVAAIAAPVCGILLAFALLPWLELTRMQAGMLLLFAVLPPAVLNFLLAERYRQQPAKVASIVVISHLITFISLPMALAYVLPRFVSPIS